MTEESNFYALALGVVVQNEIWFRNEEVLSTNRTGKCDYKIKTRSADGQFNTVVDISRADLAWYRLRYGACAENRWFSTAADAGIDFSSVLRENALLHRHTLGFTVPTETHQARDPQQHYPHFHHFHVADSQKSYSFGRDAVARFEILRVEFGNVKWYVIDDDDDDDGGDGVSWEREKVRRHGTEGSGAGTPVQGVFHGGSSRGCRFSWTCSGGKEQIL